MIVDANVWVSSLIATDVHQSASQAWLQRAMTEGTPIAIPLLALAEIAGALSRREGRTDLAEAAVAQVLGNPAVRVVTLDLTLGRLAAEIAAHQRLRGADAVYVATARALDMPLLTWDRELHARARGVVTVLYP